MIKHEEKIKKLIESIQIAKEVVDFKESEFLNRADEYDALLNINTLEAHITRRNILRLAPNDLDYHALRSAYAELRKQLNKHDYYNICNNNGL